MYYLDDSFDAVDSKECSELDIISSIGMSSNSSPSSSYTDFITL